jgi:MFS family permease
MSLGVLRDRNFRLLWAGSTISGLGSWLLVVAAPVQAYRLTGSTMAISLTLVLETVPVLLVGPWAGVLADRYSRRATMVAADLLSAAGVALILMGTTPARISFIYAGLLAENTAAAFFQPAARALIPAVVGPGPGLAAANSLSAFTGGAARLIVPPLGALLLAAVGFEGVVGIDVASYLASAAMSAALAGAVASASAAGRHAAGPHAAGPHGGGPDSGGPDRGGFFGLGRATGQLLDGMRYLGRTPLLRGLIMTSWAYWTVNAAGSVLLVPFVVRRLGGQGPDIGYLIAGLGAGYLIGAAASRPVISRYRTRPVLVTAYAAVGVCLAALFNAPTLTAAVIAAALAGIPGAVALVVTQCSVQAAAPDAVLGRVCAAFGASDAAAAIAGALLAPALTAAAGLPATLEILGPALVAVAAAAMILLPRLPVPAARSARLAQLAAGPENDEFV